MLNSKLEKILFVLLWYSLLIFFRFVLPIAEPPSNTDKYVVLIVSVLVTIILFRIYVYYRNKCILKKIYTFLSKGFQQEAMKFVNKCFEKQKNHSTYIFRLYTLAMCGKFTEFEKLLLECEKSRKYKKLLKMDFVQGSKSVINYFKGYENDITSVNQLHWNKIINVLSLQECEKNITDLLSMYDDVDFGIIKSVLALKIHSTFKKMGNIEKAEFFYGEAVKYSPSLETTYYIENNGLSKKN